MEYLRCLPTDTFSVTINDCVAPNGSHLSKDEVYDYVRIHRFDFSSNDSILVYRDLKYPGQLVTDVVYRSIGHELGEFDFRYVYCWWDENKFEYRVRHSSHPKRYLNRRALY